MTRKNMLGAWLLAISQMLTTMPANAQIAVTSSLSQDIGVTPGSTHSGTVTLSNQTNEDQQAKIYQTDYLFYADGTNLFAEPGSTVRSNAEWILLSASTVTLPPFTSMQVDYEINMPDDYAGEDLVGSYWSMIMVEGIPRDSEESTLPQQSDELKVGLRQVVRYAIQVATHVESTGQGILAVSEPSVVYGSENIPELRLVVANEGDRMVKPESWVELYDEDGQAMGRFSGTTSRIYPGTSISQRFRLTELPPGQYRALAILDSGGDAVDAADYTIMIEGPTPLARK